MASNPPPSPPAHINHIALSIPSLTQGIDFYTSTLNFTLLAPPATFTRSTAPASVAPVFAVYGPALQSFKMAFLVADNGVGLELFEFVDPRIEFPALPSSEGTDGANAYYPWNRTGLFHWAVTDADPQACAARVVAAGGRVLGDGRELVTGSGARAVYIADPWGNVLEVCERNWVGMVGGGVGVVADGEGKVKL